MAVSCLATEFVNLNANVYGIGLKEMPLGDKLIKA
jgi:hypothetical protein